MLQRKFPEDANDLPTPLHALFLLMTAQTQSLGYNVRNSIIVRNDPRWSAVFLA
jgi:hypothetical protein